MRDPTISRRAFLSNVAKIATASVACAETLPVSNPAGQTMPAARVLRLGGPIFVHSDDPAVLAQAHRVLGYRAAYAPDVKLTDKDRINSIIKEFASRDVVIAEVGAWKNMLDPDPEKRRENMAYIQERLALAEELGARCCVDIAGSYDPHVWYGPNPRNI